MTDREKLIKLLKSNPYANTPYSIADHLLANGVIVLPCKAGDTVYVLREVYEYGGNYYREISEETAEVFSLGTDEDFYSLEQFGKTVFLTREEAEAALKKGQE